MVVVLGAGYVRTCIHTYVRTRFVNALWVSMCACDHSLCVMVHAPCYDHDENRVCVLVCFVMCSVVRALWCLLCSVYRAVFVFACCANAANAASASGPCLLGAVHM